MNALFEARIDYSSIDLDFYKSLYMDSVEEINQQQATKILNDMKKLAFKPLQEFLEIINILQLPVSEIKTYDSYTNDKSKRKIIDKIDKAFKKISDQLLDDVTYGLNLLVVFYFKKVATKNLNKIKYVEDVIRAISFNFNDYFENKEELEQIKKVGSFGKWFIKCKDLCTAGSFNWTKEVKSYAEFNGLLDEYKKSINSYMSKMTKNEKQQAEFINILLDGKKNDAIAYLNSHDGLGDAFNPYVVHTVYENSGFSYVLCACMILAINKVTNKVNKPELLMKFNIDGFISFISKMMNESYTFKPFTAYMNAAFNIGCLNEAEKIKENRAHKNKVIKKIYDLTKSYTSKLYNDDYWKGVSDIRSAISSITDITEVLIYPINGGYRTSKDGLSHWKEYEVELTGEDFTIKGTLNCHAAGSVSDPFDRYDMSLVIY